MLSTILAFLSAHSAAEFVLGCMLLSVLLHVPTIRTRFPRIVAFIQAALPGDLPKMTNAAKDSLPPTDKVIVQVVDALINGTVPTPAAAVVIAGTGVTEAKAAEVVASARAAAKVPPIVGGVIMAIAFVLAFVGCSIVLPGCAAVPKLLDLAVTDAPLALCIYEAVDHGAKTVQDAIAKCPDAANVAAHDVEILMGSHRIEAARAGACKP